MSEYPKIACFNCRYGDRIGEPIILRPEIKVNEPEAAAKIVKRLAHISKYQAVQELDNHNLTSQIKDRIEIEILGKMDDFEAGDTIEPEPFADPENPTLNIGEFLFLKIRNNYSSELNFTVLDLEPNWAISQIEPTGDGLYTPLSEGEEKLIVLNMSLPEGEEQGSDIFNPHSADPQMKYKRNIDSGE